MAERCATRIDRLRYSALLTLLWPLLALYTGWTAYRQGGGWRYLRERLGFGTEVRSPAIWLHAASVGEINAAVPLLHGLATRQTGHRLLVTTNTPTGAATLRRHFPDIDHAYLPIDLPVAVRRFLARHRPECLLIVETELWPNLYRACADSGVPLVIVNARLSPRTSHAAPWIRRLYADTLARVTVLTRSESDRNAYLRLGVPPDRCHTVGNLKFAALPKGGESLRLPRPYVLAASTREGEEALILQAWRRTRSEGRLLVLVPRHPRRLPRILADLEAMGAFPAVRSRNDPVTPKTEVYLADTFGELAGFMSGAEVVLMGGSLVPKGGQNLLEPAALGRPVVVGPHMENFQAETARLLAAEAVRQVTDPAHLADTLSGLLANEDERQALAERASAVITRERDVAERYLAALETLCEAVKAPAT